jgi:hypothetical protein
MKSQTVEISRGQIELPIAREAEKDRNFEKGGRSFYFFDFDDNVAFLSTPAYIFHKETGAELQLSSGEFAQQSRFIGRSGPYADYRVDVCDRKGTFRRFRDQDLHWLQKHLGRRKQVFVQDLAAAVLLSCDPQPKACFGHHGAWSFSTDHSRGYRSLCEKPLFTAAT